MLLRRSQIFLVAFLTTLALAVFSSQLRAQPHSVLPLIPVGDDAYTMWSLWHGQRIGTRAYMRSTYDRSGGNRFADASHYLYGEPNELNFSLAVQGKGALYFFRTNHWHGSPWHFFVDGDDNIVQETATLSPIGAKSIFPKTEFIPPASFPEPLAWTWSTTKGADLIWVPMMFRDSLRIAYRRTFYGTGYYIYHLFSNEEQLSQPLQTWSVDQQPKAEVVQLLEKSGTDIAPQNIDKLVRKVELNQETVELFQIKAAKPQLIRALKFSVPVDQAIDLERVRIRVTWDDRSHPSVDAPLCLFFGAGTFYNREDKEFLVRGFPINVRFDASAKTLELGCYYPMPFFKSAKIELVGVTPGSGEVVCEVRHENLSTPASHSGYFHATYTDVPNPEPGRDMVYLDTNGIEGAEDWSGSFVGTSFIFSHDGDLNTLEGDPRFFFDDAQTPQAYGTGTEEWGGGGDYWGGVNMTLPLAGHPCGARSKNEAKNDKDLIQSAYRFLLADLMPFGKRALIRFEHGAENLSMEHYESVVYWYGLPAPSLVKSDELDIGNASSEESHNYHSPDASPVETIVSRYELGIDKFPKKVWAGEVTLPPEIYKNLVGTDVFPEQEQSGRHTRGTSEFTAAIDPENHGVLLRRTLDYKYPNQTAEVQISEPDSDNWKTAGIWYLAGSNTCYYTYPKGETIAAIRGNTGEIKDREPVVFTSNRQFRDDEFMIPKSLTTGKSKIRVRLRFVDNNRELLPGIPYPHPSAWSELKYEVYSVVIPKYEP